MIKFEITLDGNKIIYGDETSTINDQKMFLSYDSFKEFCLDEIFNHRGIIDIKTSKELYCFPSNRVVCLSFYD